MGIAWKTLTKSNWMLFLVDAPLFVLLIGAQVYLLVSHQI